MTNLVAKSSGWRNSLADKDIASNSMKLKDAWALMKLRTTSQPTTNNNGNTNQLPSQADVGVILNLKSGDDHQRLLPCGFCGHQITSEIPSRKAFQRMLACEVYWSCRLMGPQHVWITTIYATPVLVRPRLKLSQVESFLAGVITGIETVLTF